jgi:hypothetical protein
MKTTHESFVVHKTRRQHQQMEDLMTCAYEVKASGKPALRYLSSVSHIPSRMSNHQEKTHSRCINDSSSDMGKPMRAIHSILERLFCISTPQTKMLCELNRTAERPKHVYISARYWRTVGPRHAGWRVSNMYPPALVDT